jgi:plasmid replication initiation protein
MSQTVITHEASAPDGMTLRELHDLLAAMVEQGMPSDQVVRVRTKFAANKHGAAIRALTVTGSAK